MLRWLFPILMLGLSLPLAAAVPANPSATDKGASVPGNTLPSEYLQSLRFSQPGVVAEVLVKPGDLVKAGQKLIALDSRQEQKELEFLKLDTSDLPIKAAIADKDLKDVILKRVEQQFAKTVATQQELDQAKVEAEIAKLKVEKSKQDQQQAKLKVEKQQLRIDEMTLVAKVDGVVEKVDLHLGETADPTKPAVTIVKNDPLWMNVYLPTAAAQMLKIGDKLPVRYVDDPQAEAQTGAVIYRAPQADPGSARQLIRLELANKADGNKAPKDSGLRVLVELPEAVQKAMAKDDRQAWGN